MTKNKKNSSEAKVSQAAKTLSDTDSSRTAKKLAASVLSQADPSKQTSSEMEQLASKVLQSSKYNEDTKSLAGSVLSQADTDS